MRFLFLVFSFSFSILQTAAQSDSTLTELEAVDIQAYFVKQPILSLTSSAKVLSKKDIAKFGAYSLTSVVNTTPGVRMEERSPGSYRLAIRGSMIRSPFGVRNVKIYMDEFPLTDAGGNTYFNLIDPLALADIQILKGPDGSLYGPNSGGVVQLTPNGFQQTERSQLSFQSSAGSFGLFHEQLSLIHTVNDNYKFSFDHSFMRSDNYRSNSALNKKTFQTAHQWDYHKHHRLKAFVLYSDLGYHTPGGLTLEQYNANPKDARPAAGPNPSAKEQKAAIYNKTIYAGLNNQSRLSKHLTHQLSVFGSYTDFENPFITNYEFRDERNIGLRTHIAFDTGSERLQWQTQVGIEAQKGWYEIVNYDNNQGNIGDLQAEDKLSNGQFTAFARTMLNIDKKWKLETSIGLNTNNIYYTELSPIESEEEQIKFGNTWMPRFAASYLVSDKSALRASVSKGFSAPTIAEVRPSDNQVNDKLQPEVGTNYEIGWRWQSSNRRFISDIASYYYAMNNGIVKQLREDGADYYNNAGAMIQKGIEFSLLSYVVAPNKENTITGLSLESGLSYNHYRFDKYIAAEEDYSGNKVTAVPDWIITGSLHTSLVNKWDIDLFYNYSSSVPLNDENSYFADAYHLLQAKISWRVPVRGYNVGLFLGADNLLDQRYSLGNDINAFGNRFYNAAPSRNYYGGVKVVL